MLYQFDFISFLNLINRKFGYLMSHLTPKRNLLSVETLLAEGTLCSFLKAKDSLIKIVEYCNVPSLVNQKTNLIKAINAIYPNAVDPNDDLNTNDSSDESNDPVVYSVREDLLTVSF